MKKIVGFICMCTFLFLLNSPGVKAQEAWEIWELPGTKLNNYTITVTLSDIVDESSLSDLSIFAEDEWLNKIDLRIEAKDNIIYISPKNSYNAGSTISIFLNSNVQTKEKKHLKNPTKVVFSVEAEKEIFTPRADSENKISFDKKIIELKSSQIFQYEEDLSLITLINVDTSQFFDSILYFPPDERYPFGFYRYAISVRTESNDRVIVETVPVELEDNIKTLDISQEVEADATDFELNPEFLNSSNVYVSENMPYSSARIASLNYLASEKSKIHIKTTKNSLKIEFEGFEFNKKKFILDGSIQIKDIKSIAEI